MPRRSSTAPGSTRDPPCGLASHPAVLRPPSKGPRTQDARTRRSSRLRSTANSPRFRLRRERRGSRASVRMLTTDVFGQPVKPLARGFEKDEPLVCLLDKTLPPVCARDRAHDLCTGGEPCLHRGSRDLQREHPRIRCRMDLQVLAFALLPHIAACPPKPTDARPLLSAAADRAMWSAGTDVTSHGRPPCAWNDERGRNRPWTLTLSLSEPVRPAAHPVATCTAWSPRNRCRAIRARTQPRLRARTVPDHPHRLSRASGVRPARPICLAAMAITRGGDRHRPSHSYRRGHDRPGGRRGDHGGARRRAYARPALRAARPSGLPRQVPTARPRHD